MKQSSVLQVLVFLGLCLSEEVSPRCKATHHLVINDYNALVRSHFAYCCEVWDSLGSGIAHRFQKLQTLVRARVTAYRENEHGWPVRNGPVLP